ncbi:hypothetical protein BJY59DRAFT_400315 [Rhodotorula toruloides]
MGALTRRGRIPSPLPPQRLVLPPRALRLSRCPSYGVSTCSSIDCTSYRSADALATRPSHGSQPAPRWLGLAPSPHKVETAVSATLSLPQLSNAPPACLTSHRHCPWTSHTFVSRTFGSIRLPCLTRPSRRALPAPTCHYQGHTPLRMSFEPNNASPQSAAEQTELSLTLLSCRVIGSGERGCPGQRVSRPRGLLRGKRV